MENNKKAHNRIDMVGKQYNSWLILQHSHTDGKVAYYQAKCMETGCGEIHIVHGNNVRRGLSKRCVKCGPKYSGIKRTGKKRSKLTAQQMCVKYLYNDKKKSATKRGIIWGLTLEQFESIIFKPCHYSGLPPNTTTNVLMHQKLHKLWGRDGWITYNGLDRLDNSKGYVIDNVVPCDGTINKAKNDSTKEEFLSWVKAIAAHQGWIE